MKAVVRAILLFALPGIFASLAPTAPVALLYERTAILEGEWWRLWTGHWVHFSASHLLWNLAALLTAGLWLERSQSGWMLRLVLFAAPTLSLLLLIGEPGMQTYGGLSGLACCTVVLLALVQIRRRSSNPLWWWAIVLLVAAKIGIDAFRGGSLFVEFGGQAVRPSALAHAAGAAVALALFCIRSPQRSANAAPAH